ncbi:FecR family protein [Flagellimonas sp. 2504JD1-5]
MDKDYIIKKWLNNDLTKEEEHIFDEIEDSGLLKEIIEEANRFRGQNRSKVVAFEELEEKLDQRKDSNTNWTRFAYRAAAIFVLGIGLYFVLKGDDQHMFTTQMAQTEVINLPDNSKVTLNSLSQLSFNDVKWDEERSLQLKGEAYFDVTKGKKFEVHTPFGKISVLGTEFNVIARDSIFSVVCYEGLVQVAHNNDTTQLPAGKGYHFFNNTPQVVNVALSQPKWLQDLSVFEEATIVQVIKVLEEEYQVQVVLDQIDVATRFTGAFEHDNLENALQAITQTLKLTYEFSDTNTVIIRNAKK